MFRRARNDKDGSDGRTAPASPMLIKRFVIISLSMCVRALFQQSLLAHFCNSLGNLLNLKSSAHVKLLWNPLIMGASNIYPKKRETLWFTLHSASFALYLL